MTVPLLQPSITRRGCNPPRRFRMRTPLLLASLAAGWSMCACTGMSPVDLRYRVDISVDVNGKEYSGSGVIEDRAYCQKMLSGLANGVECNQHVIGEAVPVDLGARGLLFLTLTGTQYIPRDASGHDVEYAVDAWQILTPIFKQAGFGFRNREAFRAVAAGSASVQLPFDGLPMLVRFDDLSNPLTVHRVDPANLAASFGPGVELKRVTVSITQAPVSHGIALRLPWVRKLGGLTLDGQRYHNSRALTNRLSGRDFISPD